ncbi:cell division protein FtsA [Rubritalea halochordaticola]|uniref:Cell division protein FtsA n=1 Tax=Rubritalea halochordaticola TaxID=714537 RepID=A0ABP9UYX8_9BACT
MADPQSIITLNIGSQRVSMGLFSQSKDGGLILKKYDTTTILADPAADMTRLPQIRVAIAELASKLGVSKAKVDYAISGQSVFTRFVKLPALDSDNIEQLVTFEAQQHVPFPINEVIWDWQKLDVPGAEQEVVLVAIKSDALDEINDCVFEAGMDTGSVDAAPMALCNAFRMNYPDLDEPALLIDIGARTSNLIYMEGKRIFTRSISIGGSTVTTAIAKEYNVPFTEAESQKCTNGMVALDTRHTSQMDELTGALATCIRTALNRMPAEIARTTNYFRSQHGGNAPKRVFISGGGSNLPNIVEFFQEKLRLPVEKFNPLKRVSVGQGVDVDRVSVEAHLLGELVGLALRHVGKAQLAIDLVPDVVQAKRDDARRKPYLIGAAAIIIASFGGLFAYQASKSASEESQYKKAAKRVQELEQFARPIESATKNEEKISEVVGKYLSAHDGQAYWLGAINEVKTNFADPYVWVVDFDPIVNYSPDEVKDGEVTGRSAIKDDFPKTESGKSSMASIALAEPEFDSKGRRNRDYVAPMINAVRIKGLWRGQNGSSKVNSMAEKFNQESEYFTFTMEVKDGERGNKTKTITLPTNKVVVENQTSLNDNYAAPFTVILPLKQPIPLKK